MKGRKLAAPLILFFLITQFSLGLSLETSLEGEEGLEFIRAYVASTIPGTTDDELDTVQTFSACYVLNDIGTVEECIESYEDEILAHPKDVISDFESDEREEERDNGDDELDERDDGSGDVSFKVERDGSNEHTISLKGEFEDYSFVDSEDQNFNPSPGETFSIEVYEDDLDSTEYLEFEAPDFDFDHNLGYPVVQEGNEVDLEISGFNGGEPHTGRSDSGLMVDRDEVSDSPTLSGTWTPSSTGEKTVTGYAVDNSSGDGIRVYREKELEVGDGYTQDLEYPGVTSQVQLRSPFQSDGWELYKGENNDLEEVDINDWDTRWSPTNSESGSWQDEKGLRVRASAERDYIPETVKINNTLSESIGEKVGRAEFKVKTDSDNATITLKDGETVYETIQIEEGTTKYELAYSDPGYELYDGEKTMNLDAPDSETFISNIGFEITSEHETEQLVVRYLLTELEDRSTDYEDIIVEG